MELETIDLRTRGPRQDVVAKLCGRLLATDLYDVKDPSTSDPVYAAGTRIDDAIAQALADGGLDSVLVIVEEATVEEPAKPREDTGQADAMLDEVLKLLSIFTHQDHNVLRRTLKSNLKDKKRLSLADRRKINLALAAMMASNAHYLEKIIHGREVKAKEAQLAGLPSLPLFND